MAEPTSIAIWVPISSALLGGAIAIAVARLTNRSQDVRDRNKRRQDFLAQQVRAYGIAYVMVKQSIDHSARTERAGAVVLRRIGDGSITHEEAVESRRVIAEHFHAVMKNDMALASFFKDNIYLFDPEDLPLINKLVYSAVAREVEMQPAEQGIRSRLPMAVAAELELEHIGPEWLEKIEARFREVQRHWKTLSMS
ncbi:MAG: hypothetical protein AAB152_16585 [Candidatus Coatesbacteria bacterium]